MAKDYLTSCSGVVVGTRLFLSDIDDILSSLDTKINEMREYLSLSDSKHQDKYLNYCQKIKDSVNGKTIDEVASYISSRVIPILLLNKETSKKDIEAFEVLIKSELANNVDNDLKQSAIDLISQFDVFSPSKPSTDKDYEKEIFLKFDSENITYDLIENIKTLYTALRNEGYTCEVITYRNIKNDLQSKTAYRYTEKEIEELTNLNDFLIKNSNKELLYQESLNLNGSLIAWKHSTVCRANSELSKVILEIKDKHLSPFETMIFIHKYASSFKYNEGKSAEEARTITGLYDKKDIVCVGYATLVKAIVDELNMEGLEAQINTCDVRTLDNLFKSGKHVNNIIKIKDDKYDIDGIYMEDACWDSALEGAKTKGRGLAHLLYPIQDITKLSSMIYRDLKIETLDQLIHCQIDEEKLKLHSPKTSLRDKIRIKVAILKREIKTIVKKPEIYERVHSNPITLNAYKNGFYTLLKTLKPYNSETQLQKDTKKEIEKSVARSTQVFSKSADNCFAQEIKCYKKDEMRKIKLDNNLAVIADEVDQSR